MLFFVNRPIPLLSFEFFLILRLYQTHFNISDYNICIFDDIFPTTKAIAIVVAPY